MKLRFYTLVCCFFQAYAGIAQLGGSGIYEFLNTPTSARVAALGGVMVPVKDGDFNTSFQNPSLLTGDLSQIPFSLNHIIFPAGIQNGNFFIAKHSDKWGNFIGGLQYISYGKSTEANAYGDATGTFGSSEFAASIHWKKQSDSVFSYAVGAKLIGSYLYNVSSYGAATDFSATYYIKPHDFTFTASVRNLGVELKTYDGSSKQPLPLSIQAGISKKLSRAPLRWMIILQHLEKRDLTYVLPPDPNAGTSSLGSETAKTTSVISNTADMIMRHVIIGAELVFSKNFQIHLSYNYLMRQELSTVDKSGFTGLAFGFSLRISSINLAYAHSNYHLAGGINQFTLGLNMSSLYKKHKV